MLDIDKQALLSSLNADPVTGSCVLRRHASSAGDIGRENRCGRFLSMSFSFATFRRRIRLRG